MQKVCQFIIFKLLGWKVLGEVPTAKKFIIVGLPHTSNWDFVIAWLAVTAMDLEMKLFTKDVYHIWPVNYVAAMLGILPVNRRKSTNFVGSVADMYRETDTLHAALSPEGTRTFTKTLKSGYYHIARTAEILIVVAGPDYKDKTFTFMPARAPLPTFEEDQQNLIEFCKTLHGKYPENSFR